MTDKEKLVTAEDCHKIIKRYHLGAGNFEIVGFNSRPFSDGVNGFMGDHLSLTIYYKDAQEKEREARFFVKRFPFNHELQSQYARSVGAFANEINTYEVMFKEFKQKFGGFDESFAPKYYYGKADDVLVFEDLSRAGFRLPEEPNNVGLMHIKMVLKLLAKFHAGSIAYEHYRSKDAGRKYSLLEEFGKHMQEPLFRKDPNFLGYHWFCARLNALKALVDQLPEGKRVSKQGLEQVADQAFELIKPSDRFVNVLCHGDMWAKNVMFRYDSGIPVECKLIDFQLQRYCPPAHDVLQFIYLTTSTERRKHHLHDLLQYYYQNIKDELENGGLAARSVFPYEDFEGSVHHLLPQIKLQTAYYYSFQGANPEFHKRVTSDPTEFKKFVFGDGAPFAKELFESDLNYRNLMSEALEELRYHCTNPVLSMEDCFAIIRKKSITDYKLLGHDVRSLRTRAGFLGDHFKVKISLLSHGNERVLNFFAKTAPQNKTQFDLAVKSGALRKELFLYRTFLPLVEQSGIELLKDSLIPCLLARLNDIMIFDDMDLQGYRSANPREPCSFETLKIVLNQLAKFHASALIVEERLGRSLLEDYSYEVAESFYTNDPENAAAVSMGVCLNHTSFIIDQFPDPQSTLTQEEFKRKFEVVRAKLYELVKPSKRFRNVICHGDLWGSNIMVREEEGVVTDCKIIDFQITRYCPPAQDVLTTIYLNTTKEVRVKHMSKLLEFYHTCLYNTLKDHGCNAEKIYPFNTFVESCIEMTPQAVLQSLTYAHFTLVDPEIMKEYMRDEETTNQLFQGDRTNFLSDVFRRDPVHRERMKQMVDELRSVCEKYF